MKVEPKCMNCREPKASHITVNGEMDARCPGRRVSMYRAAGEPKHYPPNAWHKPTMDDLAASPASQSAPAEPPPHPEDVCERCGRENVTWFAPSDLWNRAALDLAWQDLPKFTRNAFAAARSTPALGNQT